MRLDEIEQRLSQIVHIAPCGSARRASRRDKRAGRAQGAKKAGGEKRRSFDRACGATSPATQRLEQRGGINRDCDVALDLLGRINRASREVLNTFGQIDRYI